MVDGTHILYTNKDNYKKPLMNKSKSSNNIIHYLFPCLKKDKSKIPEKKIILNTQYFTYDDIFKDSS
jgi:hypothetical protein